MATSKDDLKKQVTALGERFEQAVVDMQTDSRDLFDLFLEQPKAIELGERCVVALARIVTGFEAFDPETIRDVDLFCTRVTRGLEAAAAAFVGAGDVAPR